VQAMQLRRATDFVRRIRVFQGDANGDGRSGLPSPSTGIEREAAWGD
jgi:hypothetical protein